LWQQGYQLVLHYHRNAEAVHRYAADWQATDATRRIHCLQADFTCSDAVAALAHACMQHVSSFHCVLHNAGLFAKNPLGSLHMAQWAQELAVNFMAPVHLTELLAPHMPQGSTIVMLLDSYITRQHSPYAGYLLAKKALADYVRMAACHYGPRVRVHGLCPGILPTSLDVSPALRTAHTARLPLGAPVTLEDITAMLGHILASHATTGMLWYADGGHHLGG
jgi:3alpha(or 20beta)-hydroxysteroid dehydrogenase